MSDSEHAAYFNAPFYEVKQVRTEQGYHLPVTVVEVLTLRDQFAMAAITGFTSPDKNARATKAEYAYAMADAMLEARK